MWTREVATWTRGSDPEGEAARPGSQSWSVAFGRRPSPTGTRRTSCLLDGAPQAGSVLETPPQTKASVAPGTRAPFRGASPEDTACQQSAFCPVSTWPN